jgi:hypothetical protein
MKTKNAAANAANGEDAANAANVWRGFLEELQLGPAQVCGGGMAVVPLLRTAAERGADYATMGDALAAGTLEITETDEEGRVPELRVANRGKCAVLLMRGEEVRGAKQNRILDASVLLAAGDDIIAPVSCTEQGRWRRQSRRFVDSEILASASLRRAQTRKVYASLKRGGGHRADQGEVWDKVGDTLYCCRAESPTGAMGAAFAAKSGDLEKAARAAPLLSGQCGALFVIGGKVAGMDALSRTRAYSRAHERIVKSYAMDALLSKRGGDGGEKKTDDADSAAAAAKAFFISAKEKCEVGDFPAVALGCDLQIQSPAASGFALAVAGVVIHCALFAGEL